MRFIEAAALQSSGASVVACDAGLSAEAIELAASFDLMALVYFPSTRCFVNTWSDPATVVREGFPMRAPMRDGGFRHVWLRCEEMELSGAQPID